MSKPIKVTRVSAGKYRIVAADGSVWHVSNAGSFGAGREFGWVGYDEANAHSSDRLPTLADWKHSLSQVKS